MSDKACDGLIKYVIDTDMTRDDLVNLSVILKTGVKVEDAIEHLHTYHVYHAYFVADRSEIGKRMEARGLPSTKRLFEDIIYGKEKPLTKPSFIKI